MTTSLSIAAAAAGRYARDLRHLETADVIDTTRVVEIERLRVWVELAAAVLGAAAEDRARGGDTDFGVAAAMLAGTITNLCARLEADDDSAGAFRWHSVVIGALHALAEHRGE